MAIEVHPIRSPAIGQPPQESRKINQPATAPVEYNPAANAVSPTEVSVTLAEHTLPSPFPVEQTHDQSQLTHIVCCRGRWSLLTAFEVLAEHCASAGRSSLFVAYLYPLLEAMPLYVTDSPWFHGYVAP